MTQPEPQALWSAEGKLRIASETLAPSAMAKVVADRHVIGTGLLFTWWREMLTTAMLGITPVTVVPEPPPAAAVAPAKADGVSSLIEVAFPTGMPVRISGAVDRRCCGLCWRSSAGADVWAAARDAGVPRQ